MSKLVDLAAVDFRFFRAFIDGDDKMYEKFVKNCPSELEGLSSVKEIVESFKKHVLNKCKFIAICNSVLPAINNITICRNYFVEDDNETNERKDFRKEFNHAYLEDKNVMEYSDCIIYSEDDSLTNEFLMYTIQNKLIHRAKKVKDKNYINTLLDVDFEFLNSVMDVNTTNKNPEIPWKHLPCLPVYIKNDEIYHTFDMSFVPDDDGQTYLNLYNKDYVLVERHPYKKIESLEVKE